MSIRNLERFFHAQSVAVIGASDRPHSVGATIMRNLVHGQFAGRVMPVNPNHARVHGVRAAPDVAALEQAPDLAVVCSPPASVPGAIAGLGARGCKAAVVITGGLSAFAMPDGRSAAQAMLDAARPHLLRILGPNCLGLIVPGIALNASFAHTTALPGRLAFVSQSGALATTILDWGKARGIGFSCFISLGDSGDVDFGDLLDYLGSDANTNAILMYMESIKHARKFMSAARAAARAKPVIVVKAGRNAEGARAAASHTGALAGSDEIFDAALRRAGILRVATTEDLFNAAETLARVPPTKGRRLMIMTNGGGAAVLATDALIAGGGELAPLTPAAQAALDQFLPSTWSRANPVDIIGDAPVERYVRTLQELVTSSDADAILLMHAPTAIVPSEPIARACIPAIKACGKPVLTVWLGAEAVRSSRAQFARNAIATYETPEQAVGAFLHLAEYRRSQELLLQTPPALALEAQFDAAGAQRTIAAALSSGATLLSEVQAKALLSAYGIPVVRTEIARDAEHAVALARSIGYPVALKIFSPDITHKSDVGGVALHLDDERELRSAAQDMLRHVTARAPQARIEGFTVQTMVERGGDHELILGCSVDPIFGPVILFGHGGTAVEVVRDRAFALPPLNAAIARDLISRTRVAKLLAGYRDVPAVDEAALLRTLVSLSQLICDRPEIQELDINPLLASARGVVALDARVRVQHTNEAGDARLAIRPYPQQLEELAQFDAQPLLLRPIRPEDETAHREFLARLAPEDTYFRFFQVVRNWPHAQIARLTQIDYDREMAFVAIQGEAAQARILGVARAVTDPDNARAEFAVVVRSDLKGKGLGTLIMEKLVRYCRQRGTRELYGYVLPENRNMLSLAKALGFRLEPPREGAQEVVLPLA